MNVSAKKTVERKALEALAISIACGCVYNDVKDNIDYMSDEALYEVIHNSKDYCKWCGRSLRF